MKSQKKVRSAPKPKSKQKEERKKRKVVMRKTNKITTFQGETCG
jgi:hypothetical protein